jgi:hypothetical protein
MATAERMVVKIEATECARAAAKHASDKAAFDAAVEKFRKGHAATVAGAFAPVLFSGCLLLNAAALMPNEEAIQAAYLALPAMKPADRAEARAGELCEAMLALLPAVSVSA